VSAVPSSSASAADVARRLATPATAVPFILVGIVLLMVVPLPPMVLDLCLAGSIALAMSLLLLSIHLEKPLELSMFPTILLFGTLLRLALNVASTRLILLQGGSGPGPPATSSAPSASSSSAATTSSARRCSCCS
jgi:flagellar biosynthesis component FlhA